LREKRFLRMKTAVDCGGQAKENMKHFAQKTFGLKKKGNATCGKFGKGVFRNYGFGKGVGPAKKEIDKKGGHESMAKGDVGILIEGEKN